MNDSITVTERGKLLSFTYAEILRYHGGGFPGGVVHALKAMQAAFALLSSAPLPRREIRVLTAFTGPGGRDCIEHVTRALTDGRFAVDRSLGGRDVISDLPGPYLWRFTWAGKTAEVTILPGHVREEFVQLGARQGRSADEEARLDYLKTEMAERLLPLCAEQIYAARLVG